MAQAGTSLWAIGRLSFTIVDECEKSTGGLAEQQRCQNKNQ
jgi:hypothetical protein